MAAYYFDASAIVKGHSTERGARWVMRIMDLRVGHEIVTARIAGVEAMAALVRRLHEGDLAAGEFAQQRQLLLAHLAGRYAIVEVSAEIVDRAIDLVQRHAMRGYDATHIAAALEVEARRRARGASRLTFVSADERQLAAARAEGLAAENPERSRA